MTYDEFQRHVGKAGLKLYEFARYMDLNPTTISNKRSRGVPRHLAMVAVLLGELADRGIDYRELLARNGIEPTAPRNSDANGAAKGNEN